MELVHHYSDVSALKSIVESRSLWASDILYLNDEREFEHGLALLKAGIEVQSAKLGRKEKNLMSQVVLDLEHRTTTIYAACFCEDGDSLSQWRSYGSGLGGVSIGFSSEALRKLKGFRVTKVLYDRNEQLKRTVELIGSLQESLRTTKGADRSPHDPHYAIAEFKHERFHDEREVRAISHRTEKDSPPKFRVRGSYLIPYIDVDLGDEIATLIKEIIISPSTSSSQQVRMNGIRHFLRSRGLNEIAVRKSDIPYRT